MTETEFRGLKLMMLEAYRSDDGLKERISAWQYGQPLVLVDANASITGVAYRERKEFNVELDANGVPQLKRALRKCFDKAFRDATLQSAYRMRGTGNTTRVGTLSWKLLRRVGMSQVERLLASGTQEDFDGVHRELLHSVCESLTAIGSKIASGNRRDENGRWNIEVPFTLGNAQKLINMMLKYCYVLSLYFSGSQDPQIRDFFDKVQRIAPFMHVPIDSVMLNYLQEHTGEEPVSIRDQHVFFEGSSWTWSAIPNTNEGYQAYMALQRICKQLAFPRDPIAWECDAWFNAR